MRKGVIFDLDGTLWDSSEEVAKSWQLALQDCPDITRKLSREDIQSVMGKTMDEIGDILFAEAVPARRKEVLSYCMERENEYIRSHGGRLFEGIREMLTELRRRQYFLAIVSNCQVGYIEAFLHYYGLGESFDDFESYGGTGKPKGENIRLVAERNRLDYAVYVGDTQGDYEAAAIAGLPFIHTRTGYGRIQGEAPTVDAPGQVADAVERIFEGIFKGNIRTGKGDREA